MIMKFHTMKHLNYLWMSLAAAMILTSSCISTSSTEVYAIPDSKTPRTMSPAIFSDVPEPLHVLHRSVSVLHSSWSYQLR